MNLFMPIPTSHPYLLVLLSFCEIWHTFKNPPIAINNASQPSLYILSVLHHISFMLCYIINSYITSDDYITELAFFTQFTSHWFTKITPSNYIISFRPTDTWSKKLHGSSHD